MINNKEFIVYSLLGEKMHTGNTTINKGIELNTTNWSPGIYNVSIKMENRNLTHRFVIE